MKKNIHPDYQDMPVICSCGHTFTTRSALCDKLHIEACHHCHSAYTGKHRAAAKAGQAEKFADRYGSFSMGG